MRDEQHRAVVISQILFEPLNRLDVEVVRGLVEQEHRRATQEQLCQLDTHTPATRKLARGAVEILASETQSEQRLFDVGLAAVATQDVIAVVALVKTVHQLLIFGRFVVVALGQRGCNALNLSLDCQHLGKGFGRFVDERSGVGHLHLLRKIADRAVAISCYGTRCGLLFARDDSQ